MEHNPKLDFIVEKDNKQTNVDTRKADQVNYNKQILNKMENKLKLTKLLRILKKMKL